MILFKSYMLELTRRYEKVMNKTKEIYEETASTVNGILIMWQKTDNVWVYWKILLEPSGWAIMMLWTWTLPEPRVIRLY